MAKIGIIGHRVLCEVDRIHTGIQQALEWLTKKFPEEPLTLLTSLAEGSDRLVIAPFRSLESSHVVAVLPLSVDKYLNDFENPESRKDFTELLQAADEVIQMPDQPDRDSSYQAAGFYVVDHCDALICIWDGKEAQSKGGTGSMIERARSRGIPIAWIHAGNRVVGTMQPTSLGAEQGTVTWENP
jgi:hypothetical protein